MSLYYKLNEDNFKGDRKEIGNIMLKFMQTLYNETGLKLCPYYFAEFEKEDLQGLEVYREEVLWKNMNTVEKANIIRQYLKEINAEKGELTIIDPYLFFFTHRPEYIELLKNILIPMKLKKLKVITSKGNYNEKLKNEL